MASSDFRRRSDSQVSEHTERLAELAIGAAIEVHRHMGPGMPELSYHNALSHELDLRGIPHRCEVRVPMHYKGKFVGEGWVDILVDGVLVLELKVVEALGPVHRSQALSYLKAMNLELALLINFNVAILKDGIKRVVNTR